MIRANCAARDEPDFPLAMTWIGGIRYRGEMI
jgi:hypothetical protein